MLTGEEIFIDIYFNAAMAMITGKAVAIWICLAFISALIIYVLWRVHQTNYSHRQHDKLNQSDEHDNRGRRKSGGRYAAIPILVFYIAFVLTITIIERTPAKEMKYKLELFWTVREFINGSRDLISEIFWNIVLFVPIGVLASLVLSVQRKANGSSHRMRRSPWIVILVGLLLSTGIEVTQLLTHRGLFELDDIFYNTLGTAIGVMIYLKFAALRRPNSTH